MPIKYQNTFSIVIPGIILSYQVVLMFGLVFRLTDENVC